MQRTRVAHQYTHLASERRDALVEVVGSAVNLVRVLGTREEGEDGECQELHAQAGWTWVQRAASRGDAAASLSKRHQSSKARPPEGLAEGMSRSSRRSTNKERCFNQSTASLGRKAPIKSLSKLGLCSTAKLNK
jgi:hypothetical protein